MMFMMTGRMKLHCVWLPVVLQDHAAYPWGPYRLPSTPGPCVRVSGCVCLSALPEPTSRSPLPAPVTLRGKAGRSDSLSSHTQGCHSCASHMPWPSIKKTYYMLIHNAALHGIQK